MPSCAPQMPTATMAIIWSGPVSGWRKPLSAPPAIPACSCANAGSLSKIRGASTNAKPNAAMGEKRSESMGQLMVEVKIRAIRPMNQNIAIEPMA